MAINFPDTPNEGDVHVVGTRSWTWDGTAWTSNTSRDYINSISETEPTNPVAGDTWFKSSTGQTFIYYDSYWIETGVAGPRGPAGTDGTDASLTRSIRTESANTTLLAADANQMLRFTGTDLQTLTIPDVLSVGESVQIVQDNTGQIEFSSGSGVTLLSDSGEFGSNGQNTKVDLVCVGAGEYRLYGELVAVVLPAFNAEYLVVAGGGGGGGNRHGGGGGAGGYRSSVIGESSGGGASAESVLTLDPATNYTVTVGAGGAGGLLGVNEGSQGLSGSNSVFSTVTSVGGGGAGGVVSSVGVGKDGGSGGAGSREVGGSGTAGQGFDGGSAAGSNDSGPGGGGASQVGQDRVSDGTAGDGGDGVASSITGSSVYYAGGGGGGGYNGAASGTGGLGGGADGSTQSTDPSPATANTGGGGGGQGGGGSDGNGSAGGSGIVILRYPSDYSITIGSGLTGTTSTVGANKVTEITAGTGNISFS